MLMLTEMLLFASIALNSSMHTACRGGSTTLLLLVLATTAVKLPLSHVPRAIGEHKVRY